MPVTTYCQLGRSRCWPGLLASLIAILSCASMTSGQEAGLAGAARQNQQSASHPLRFFQPDKVPATGATRGNHASTKQARQTSLATLPIQQPSPDRTANSSDPTASSPRSATQAMTTILSALSIVLGAFFLVVWLTRSASKRRWSPLPSEAVQLLGRTPLAGRQWMQLIRVGNKLVMVSVNGNQVDTITEITDPEEVEHLVSLCHKNQPNQFRQTFQQVLNQHQQNDPNGASSGSFQHEHSYFANTE